MARKSSSANEELLPDHLRCGRTDGKQWRCKKRVMDNLKLCEIHYLQGKHRQYREKVPESLKLQRKRKNKEEEEQEAVVVVNNAEETTTRVEKEFKMELRKTKKKKVKLAESSESLTDSPSGSAPARKKTLKQCDTQLDLIRMVLEKEVEKRKKNKNNTKKNKKKKMKKKVIKEEVELHDYNEGELRRELPNGVMEISPSRASTPGDYNNVSSHCDVKIGDHRVVAVTPHYFRSKNIDRTAVGKLQVVPYGPNLKKGITKRKCHSCQRSDSLNLVQCSSCQKEFFCFDCIRDRYLDTRKEVKKACPVCQRTCTCKVCLSSQSNDGESKDSESKAYLSSKTRVDRILHFHYLICMLLPVVKRISQNRDTELETEAKIQGKSISDIQIKQVEFGYSENIYCNHCKTPVLDLHRSCASCSYSLCLSCCEKICQGRTSGEINSSLLKLRDQMEACVDSERRILEQKDIRCGNLTATSTLPERTNCNDTEKVSCPPMEFGGCGTGLFDSTATSTLPERTNCNDIEKVSCPPTELGGCGTGLLDLTATSTLPEMTNCNKIEKVSCPSTEFGGCGTGLLDLTATSTLPEMTNCNKIEKVSCSPTELGECSTGLLDLTATSTLPERTNCNDIEKVSCPHAELGGRDTSLLDLTATSTLPEMTNCNKIEKVSCSPTELGECSTGLLDLTATSTLPERTNCNDIEKVSCPHAELGGRDTSLLDLTATSTLPEMTNCNKIEKVSCSPTELGECSTGLLDLTATSTLPERTNCNDIEKVSCLPTELGGRDTGLLDLTATSTLPEGTNCNDIEKVSCLPTELGGRDTDMLDLTATSTLPEGTNCNDNEKVSCPPTELGGCGTGLLDLRCIFPSTLLRNMDVKAEEIVCSYDFPETSDKSSSCSLCFDTDLNTDRYNQLQKAAERGDSSDNCLFCPTVLDISGDNFEHFQKHWGKGHPIVVQDVLQSTSNLSWNPLFMFCTYLEQSITKYENNKELLESCLDWCEVEINIRQYFTGSLKCRPQRNTWHEMLKLKGWLSSQVFKEQFPAHFSEVIDALPVQEYMNPLSGLLNLAANLPDGSAKHDIGPYVYISYGCADIEADSVTKLCCDSYDVVNIMTHSADVPLSTEQLTKIRKLLKKHKALCQVESVATEQLPEQEVKGMALSHAEETVQKGLLSMGKEGINFFRRVDRTSCISSTGAKIASTQSIYNNISQDGERNIISDSEPSVHGTAPTTNLSPRSPAESSNCYKKKLTEHSGAQWDVFRRQDVPKLKEYIKRHYDELTNTHDSRKKMVHPILDQSIFLDHTHKMRLKEEFKIEPWTFQQHVGEAVIIPAGCPYQIRNSKCCVHAVLEFVSPENLTECIQLIDEVRRLPEDHKAKVDKLELKKMALHSMSTAIEEIRQLTCKT